MSNLSAWQSQTISTSYQEDWAWYLTRYVPFKIILIAYIGLELS